MDGKIIGTAERLAPLRPIIRSWFKVLGEHCKREKWEENPWWFGERATLSTLAGSAYRLPGWLAIEEYATEKQRSLGESRSQAKAEKTHGYGRCDLFLSKSKNIGFALEAKQAWQSIGDSRDQWDKVRICMASAWKDAGRLDKEEGERVACTFIVPSIPKSKTENADKLIAIWLKERGWEKGHGWKKGKSVAAIFFPKKAMKMTTDFGRIFPGVVMVLTWKERGNKNKKLRN